MNITETDKKGLRVLLKSQAAVYARKAGIPDEKHDRQPLLFPTTQPEPLGPAWAGPWNGPEVEAPLDVDELTEEILSIEGELKTANPDEPLDIERPGSIAHALAGRQGKCPSCRECYRWHSRRPLAGAHCPACGAELEGTVRTNPWPWNEGTEPLAAVEAWAKFHRGRI